MNLESTQCGNCGAPLQIEAGTTKVTCEACGSTFIRDVPPQSRPSRPATGGVVMHTMDRAAFLGAFAEWLSDGTYTPTDLLQAGSLNEAAPLLVPVWRFIGRYDADWTASIGYDRTEHYTDWETRVVNGKTKRVPVSKTRTVTDWQAAGGHVGDAYDVYACASDEVDPSTASFVEEMGKESPVHASSTEALGGTMVLKQAFDAERAWVNSAHTRVDALVGSRVRSGLGGDRQRDVRWTFLPTHHQVEDLLLPIWKAEFEFCGLSYGYVLDGCRRTRMIGDRPEDTEHKARAWGALAPALVLTVVALVLAMRTGTMPPAASLAPAVLAWILGLVMRARMAGASRTVRQRHLEDALARIARGRSPFAGQPGLPGGNPWLGFGRAALVSGGVPLLLGLALWMASEILADPASQAEPTPVATAPEEEGEALGIAHFQENTERGYAVPQQERGQPASSIPPSLSAVGPVVAPSSRPSQKPAEAIETNESASRIEDTYAGTAVLIIGTFASRREAEVEAGGMAAAANEMFGEPVVLDTNRLSNLKDGLFVVVFANGDPEEMAGFCDGIKQGGGDCYVKAAGSYVASDEREVVREREGLLMHQHERKEQPKEPPAALSFLRPEDHTSVTNPVCFLVRGIGGLDDVEFFADDYPLGKGIWMDGCGDGCMEWELCRHFVGTDKNRLVEARGIKSGEVAATSTLNVVPLP